MAWDPPPLPQTQPDWLTFQVWWQQVIEDIREQFGVLQGAIDAVAAAQSAADAANAAALTANDAAADAAAAATDAATAAAGANTAIAQIEAGEYDLEAITIGGQRFINDAGTLVLE